MNLGRLELLEGHLDAAQLSVQRALDASNSVGYCQGKILALKDLGELAYRRGDFNTARSRIEAAIACALELKDRWRAAPVANSLAHVLIAQRRPDMAREVWLDNLRTWSEIGNIDELATTLEGLGALAARSSDPDVRSPWASGVRRAHGLWIIPNAQVWLDGWLPGARKTLGAADARTAWTQGESLLVEEGYRLRTQREDPARSVAHQWASNAPRTRSRRVAHKIGATT